MCFLLDIFSCLAFYVVIFIKALKKSAGSIHIKSFHYLFTFKDFLFSFNMAVDIFPPHKLKW